MLNLIVYPLAAFDISFSKLIYIFPGQAVARLVETQGYKPKGRGFLILPAGVNSTTNKNDYQE
jgi:hypothetical protein